MLHKHHVSKHRSLRWVSGHIVDRYLIVAVNSSINFSRNTCRVFLSSKQMLESGLDIETLYRTWYNACLPSLAVSPQELTNYNAWLYDLRYNHRFINSLNCFRERECFPVNVEGPTHKASIYLISTRDIGETILKG